MGKLGKSMHILVLVFTAIVVIDAGLDVKRVKLEIRSSPEDHAVVKLRNPKSDNDAEAVLPLFWDDEYKSFYIVRHSSMKDTLGQTMPGWFTEWMLGYHSHVLYVPAEIVDSVPKVDGSKYNAGKVTTALQQEKGWSHYGAGWDGNIFASSVTFELIASQGGSQKYPKHHQAAAKPQPAVDEPKETVAVEKAATVDD